jgi:protein-L-isoaspartate(D-aspartate) O-methyltransferase
MQIRGKSIGPSQLAVMPFPLAVIPALGEASLRLPPAGTKFRREAKAGIHLAVNSPVPRWIPAFAGMTAARTGREKVTRLYLGDDTPKERCWLRAPGWCLAYK